MVYRLQVDDSSAPVTFNRPAIHAFIALNLIGGVGMLLILATSTIFRKVTRLATWYSFCFSWALSAVSYCLLSFSGDQLNTHPTYVVCYVQAALIYAMPPTTTATTLALCLQILLSLPDSISDRMTVVSLRVSCFLVMAPYTLLLIIFIGVAMYETENPESLQRAPQGTYCNSSNASWARVSFSVVAALAFIIVGIQVRLAKRLYALNWRPFKVNTHWIATSLRAMIFTIIGVITLIVAMLLAIKNDHSMTFDLLLATFPLLALLVFGTQKDLVFAWFNWERSRRDDAHASSLFSKDESDHEGP